MIARYFISLNYHSTLRDILFVFLVIAVILRNSMRAEEVFGIGFHNCICNLNKFLCQCCLTFLRYWFVLIVTDCNRWSFLHKSTYLCYLTLLGWYILELHIVMYHHVETSEEIDVS